MSYEAALKERYADVRGRLRGLPHGEPRRLLSGKSRPVMQTWPPVLLPVIVERKVNNVENLPDYHTTADRIIADVADKHNLTIAEIKSHRRAPRIIDARYEAYYRLTKETTLSLPQIGRKFGGFDHTSVLHGVRKHAERAENGMARNWYNPSAKKFREPVFGKGGWH